MHKNRRSKHNRPTRTAIPTPQQNFNNMPSRQTIIRDMEHVFQLALAAGKFGIALRAKELIGREFGIFLPPSKRLKLNPRDLNRDELNELVDAVMALEFEKHQNGRTIAEENAKIQAKIDSQAELYAEKRLQRARENQEFEDKQSKFYAEQEMQEED